MNQAPETESVFAARATELALFAGGALISLLVLALAIWLLMRALREHKQQEAQEAQEAQAARDAKEQREQTAGETETS